MVKEHCTCDHPEEEEAEDWFKKRCTVCNPEGDMHDESMEEI